MQGECSDENCTFAHGEGDLRVTEGIYKTRVCNFWERGFCKKGDRCNHAHGQKDLRPLSSASSPTSTMDGDGSTPVRERRNHLVLSEILDNTPNLTPQPPSPLKAIEANQFIQEPAKSITELLSWQQGFLQHSLPMGGCSPLPPPTVATVAAGVPGSEHRQAWPPLEPVDMLVGRELRSKCMPASSTMQIGSAMGGSSAPQLGQPQPDRPWAGYSDARTASPLATASTTPSQSVGAQVEDEELEVHLASLDTAVKDLSEDLSSIRHALLLHRDNHADEKPLNNIPSRRRQQQTTYRI